MRHFWQSLTIRFLVGRRSPGIIKSLDGLFTGTHTLYTLPSLQWMLGGRTSTFTICKGFLVPFTPFPGASVRSLTAHSTVFQHFLIKCETYLRCYTSLSYFLHLPLPFSHQSQYRNPCLTMTRRKQKEVGDRCIHRDEGGDHYHPGKCNITSKHLLSFTPREASPSYTTSYPIVEHQLTFGFLFSPIMRRRCTNISPGSCLYS